MSSFEMAPAAKFSYQRLRNEVWFDDDEEEGQRVIRRARSWSRFRKVPIRKRWGIKIPSLRRFLRRRARLVSAVRVSCVKVMKRLKESQAHFGDLFAGNYLFMQVSPTPVKCVQKSFMGNDLHGLSSRYPLGRIAG